MGIESVYHIGVAAFATSKNIIQKSTASEKKFSRRRTCDKAGSPWAVLGETAWQIDSAVPFFCFRLFFVLLRIFAQLAIVTILLLTPTRISECRRFYAFAVFVTRLPGCRIGSVSRVNSCSVSAGFQVFLKQSFHFLRIGGIDDADAGIVDVDVLMPHAVDLPRFMYHDL